MTIPRGLLLGGVIFLSAGWHLPMSTPGDAGERATLSFRITLTDAALEEVGELGLQIPVKGRLFVIATRDDTGEPRRQTGLRGVPFWGMDVHGLTGGSVYGR